MHNSALSCHIRALLDICYNINSQFFFFFLILWSVIVCTDRLYMIFLMRNKILQGFLTQSKSQQTIPPPPPPFLFSSVIYFDWCGGEGRWMCESVGISETQYYAPRVSFLFCCGLFLPALRVDTVVGRRQSCWWYAATKHCLFDI